MTVRARLVLVGAVLPTVALVVAVVVAGWLFSRDQLAGLDRRLLQQAAVESVGLFDGSTGGPHVHIPASPIREAVREFAPETAVYDAQGRLAAHGGDTTQLPATVPLAGTVGTTRLSHQVIAGTARRVLELPVRAPNGQVYTLWLGASLHGLEATMRTFYVDTLAAVGALALVLFAIQLAVAARLARRIRAMTSYLPRLHADAGPPLAPDPVRDEIGALNATLRDVAARLAAARDEQDRLLANAAHELRTPLTVLRTEVDLALRKQRSADELRAALRSVRDDVDRLGALATALLDLQAVRHLGFARGEGDLAALVREACAGLATVAAARQVELLVDAPARAPARFDERALRAAVDNLLGNALKHAPAGSAIEVGVRAARDRWQIDVADRGPGIPPAEAERIFEPFHTAGPTTGAGLGLAIVREVATRHDGRVWLDAAHQGGARFVLELGR